MLSGTAAYVRTQCRLWGWKRVRRDGELKDICPKCIKKEAEKQT